MEPDKVESGAMGPCLVRQGSSKAVNRIMPLNADQVVIGRGENVTYRFMHCAYLSKTHVIICKTQEGWTVTDNQTLNGTYLNDVKLKPSLPYLLSEGDMVHFNVPTSTDVLLYQYHSNFINQLPTDACYRKIKKPRHRLLGSNAETANERLFADGSGGPDSPSEALIREKQDLEKRLETLQNLLHSKDTTQATLEEELRRKEEQMKEDQIKMKQLELDKIRMESELRATFERELQCKEESLKMELMDQLNLLENEKRQVEQDLADQLTMKDRTQEEHLIAERQRLEKVIATKEMEQQVLEKQLKDAAEQSAKSQADALRAKEEVLHNLSEMVEMELQCSICSELFVQAVTLNCSHTFCDYCINEWKKKQGSKPDCPYCRMPIKSQARSVVLDSFIERMEENLPQDQKQQRRNLLTERKKLNEEPLAKVRKKMSDMQPLMPQQQQQLQLPIQQRQPISNQQAVLHLQQQAVSHQFSSRNPPARHQQTLMHVIYPATITHRPDVGGHHSHNPLPAHRAATYRNPTSLLQQPPQPPLPQLVNRYPAHQQNVVPLYADNNHYHSILAAAGAGNALPAATTTTSAFANPVSVQGSSGQQGQPIEITDSDDSNNEDNYNDFNDDDYVEGNHPRMFYRGYGRCYSCGRRGHYANGCPF